MKQQLSYYFNIVNQCDMCESTIDTHKILGKRLNQSQGKRPSKKIGISTTVVKCSNCGLIYSNPQPVPFDILDHYGIPPEAYWKKDYFRVDENYFQSEIAKLKSLMAFKEKMKSLDIGAGLGKAMMALAKAGFDTFGFEASKQFHERAISKMGISPSKLKLGTIDEVEYPENNYDFISFGAVLEHLHNPSDSILKAMKWLKPNGIMHIEIPSSAWFVGKLLNLFYRLTGTDYVSNLSPMHEPFHLYEFGLKSFQEHAKKHGYELVFHEYYVCETFLPKIFDFVLKPYMKWTNTGMQLCVWLRKQR